MASNLAVFAQVIANGKPMPIEGFTSIKCRLQGGAADELTIDMPMRTTDGKWRADMPIFQVGVNVDVKLGYDGTTRPIQSFELVGSDQQYSGDSFTIHGVSSLAAAARNKIARTFATEAEFIAKLCEENGWVNGVDATALTNHVLSKKAGETDLDTLNLIAKWAKLGGPRVTNKGVLVMPHPDGSNPFLIYRGYNDTASRGWPLTEFSPSREGSGSLLLQITAWDSERGEFINTVFEPDPFGGDPLVVSQSRALAKESSTTGLLLRLVEDHPDRTKKGRYDILQGYFFSGESDPVSLAKRWFLFRERVSRWADITVDGHYALVEPHKAVSIVGDVAAVDRGVWLPQTITHTVDNSGWHTELSAIRVVDESSVKQGEAL